MGPEAEKQVPRTVERFRNYPVGVTNIEDAVAQQARCRVQPSVKSGLATCPAKCQVSDHEQPHPIPSLEESDRLGFMPGPLLGDHGDGVIFLVTLERPVGGLFQSDHSDRFLSDRTTHSWIPLLTGHHRGHQGDLMV